VPFQVQYDARHTWNHDDFFGASLSSWDALFTSVGYRLICCNAQTGVNAFYVEERYTELFPEVPRDLHKLWVEPRYELYTKAGHPSSLKTIEALFDDRSPASR
jgi:hypothetical protein